MRVMLAASALIDFSRPTNSGIAMWGYTTTSRSGRIGVVFSEAVGTLVSCPDRGSAIPNYVR